MKKIIPKILIITILLLPVVSYAAFAGLKGLIQDAGGIITTIYRLLFVIAMAFFMFSMVQVIIKSGDPKAREEARQRMIWGIIALFIMFSINGIIYWIGKNLCINVGNTVSCGSTVLTNTP